MFFDSFRTGDRTLTRSCSSRIEGFGTSQSREVIFGRCNRPYDPKCQMRQALRQCSGLKIGSGGGRAHQQAQTFGGLCKLRQEMEAAGRSGSIVTILCDDGNRYLDTLLRSGMGDGKLRRNRLLRSYFGGISLNSNEEGHYEKGEICVCNASGINGRRDVLRHNSFGLLSGSTTESSKARLLIAKTSRMESLIRVTL